METRIKLTARIVFSAKTIYISVISFEFKYRRNNFCIRLLRTLFSRALVRKLVAVVVGVSRIGSLVLYMCNELGEYK
jgi:hypothetical protein